ncbi:MAG TPA: HAMP domain-containing sensor histidine kinase [Polyangiaceae bacterium]
MSAEVELSGLERELAALQAEVARLREREKRSEQLIRELGDAVAARDAFIAIAGHELRNPMGAVMLAATSIAHRLAENTQPLPAWLPARLASLERQARIFVRRATTLLDVSRITAGHLRLQPEAVDLARLVQDTVFCLATEAEQAKCTVTTALEAPVLGFWDRVALDQVVFNLLQNALKYGAGKPVRVTLVSRDGRAVLAVRDEGLGISGADCERIFERFERAVTQRTHGGFGLGLWITRGLVEASGGTIRVDSQPGNGSIFTVELPQE